MRSHGDDQRLYHESKIEAAFFMHLWKLVYVLLKQCYVLD